MGMLPALGLSIGVLIAVWTYLAVGVAALPVWAGIVAWACFFAAGGKTDGLVKTLAATLSGVLWAFLALTAYGRIGNDNVMVLAALVGVAAFAMVLQARISALGFIPGAFLGAATAVSVVVGANGTWPKVIVALVAGAIFAWVSERLAAMLSRTAPEKPAEARVA
jgi:hypothetical protein